MDNPQENQNLSLPQLRPNLNTINGYAIKHDRRYFWPTFGKRPGRANAYLR